MNKSRKILVVDDESNIRLLLSDILSSEGFEVTEAKDGQESLEKMEQTDFDLIITDIHMPRMDGIAMLNSMEKAGRREKVIIMTANPSEYKLSYERMPRIVTQLLKPFRIDNFVEIVMAAIANNEHIPGVQAQLQN